LMEIMNGHVDVDHVVFAKKFEEELNNFGWAIITKQPTKKRINIFTTSISNFLGSIIPLKKDDPQPKEFLEDLALLIIKNYLPMQFVRVCGWKDLQCIYVQDCCFHLENSFFKKLA
jgi:hypothetical protein